MAGSPEPVPEVNHGWKGAVFALIFALVIVAGASVATAIAVEDNGHPEWGPGYSTKYDDDHGDEKHDDHDDGDHDDHDHADE